MNQPPTYAPAPAEPIIERPLVHPTPYPNFATILEQQQESQEQ